MFSVWTNVLFLKSTVIFQFKKKKKKLSFLIASPKKPKQLINSAKLNAKLWPGG